MNQQILDYQKQIDALQKQIEGIQNNCPHKNVIYTSNGSSGNWDRDDHYWHNIYCLDCQLQYTTPQSIGALKGKTAFRVKNLNTYKNSTLKELQVLQKFNKLMD